MPPEKYDQKSKQKSFNDSHDLCRCIAASIRVSLIRISCPDCVLCHASASANQLTNMDSYMARYAFKVVHEYLVIALLMGLDY